jgi:uncharacterized protein with FMN-binding domain
MKKIALSLFVIAASGAYVWNQSGKGQAEDLLGSALPTDVTQTGSIQRRVAMAATAEPTVTPKLVPFVMRESNGSRDADEPKIGSLISAAAAAENATAPLPPQAPTLADAPPPPTPPVAANPPVIADATPPAPASAAVAVVNVPMPRPRPAYRATPVQATRAATTVAARRGYADGAYTGPAVDAYYGRVQVQAIFQSGKLVAIKVLQYPSDRRTSVAINRQALPMLRDEVITAQSASVDIISGATLTSQAFIRSLHAALSQATA